MEKIYIRDKDVAHSLSISRSTVWHYVRKGLLKAPLKLSDRVSVWSKADIEAFIASREVVA